MEFLTPILYLIGFLIGMYLTGITIKWIFYCGTRGIYEGRKKSKEMKNEKES
jgi:hypothetical protein